MTPQHANHSLTIDSQVNDASGGGLTGGKEVTLENRFIVCAPTQLYGRRALLQFAHKIAFNARASRCLSLKPPAMQVLQLHEGFF